jgi:hypothetical protein
MITHPRYTRLAIACSIVATLLVSSCAPQRVLGVEVGPTGGAGFAGLRNYELLQHPAFSRPATCAASTTCAMVPVPDSIDLMPNHHYDWRPALSTGVTFQAFAKTGAQLGGGLGANIVLLPDALGKTAPWPAITGHFGTRDNGFFLGLVLSPTDGISMPGGAQSIRVQRDHIPDLLLKNSGRSGHFYIGIRLGGKNQSLSPVARVDVAKIDTLKVGDTRQVTYTLYDSANNELSNRQCAYSTDPTNAAEVSEKGVVKAKDAGKTVVTVKCEGVSGTTTVITVKP